MSAAGGHFIDKCLGAVRTASSRWRHGPLKRGTDSATSVGVGCVDPEKGSQPPNQARAITTASAGGNHLSSSREGGR